MWRKLFAGRLIARSQGKSSTKWTPSHCTFRISAGSGVSILRCFRRLCPVGVGHVARSRTETSSARPSLRFAARGLAAGETAMR